MKINELEVKAKDLFVELSNMYCQNKSDNIYSKNFLSEPVEGNEAIVSELLDLHFDYRGIMANEKFISSDLTEVIEKLEKIKKSNKSRV